MKLDLLIVQYQSKRVDILKPFGAFNALTTNFYDGCVISCVCNIDKLNTPHKDSYSGVLFLPFNLAPFDQKLLVSRLKVEIRAVRIGKLVWLFNLLVTTIKSMNSI